MGSEIPREASNSDECFLQHSLVFSESLKDLRNIRAQLYSAAEYFESSYKKDEHMQLVEESLKDYLAKALISTVDHLGSVAYKVNSFLDEKADEISAARLRFSCIEQRLWAHREFIGCSGLLRQSVVTETPKHYKRYSIPVAENQVLRKLESIPNGCLLSPQDDMHHLEEDNCFTEAFQGTPTARPYPPLLRRGHYWMHSAESFSPRPLNFSFTRIASRKEVGKQAVSPLSFPLKRSGSVNNRSISPTSNTKQRCPEPRRSITMLLNPERRKGNELQVYSSKSKHLFRALLSMHRSRKEGVP